ncbi:MAG: hypothetical protein ABFD50_04855 [Smithella sp.]
MGLQPFNGHEIAVELAAAELIPAYTIIKFNSSDKTKCNLAGASNSPLAVAIPYDDEFMPDGAGGLVKRTGYQIGERVTAYDSGTVWVKLGATVTAGQKCVPMTGGLGAALAVDTFTDSSDVDLTAPTVPAEYAKATIDTDLGTYNTAIEGAINGVVADFNGLIDEIQAALAKRTTILGEYQVGGDAGDIVPVKIEK